MEKDIIDAIILLLDKNNSKSVVLSEKDQEIVNEAFDVINEIEQDKLYEDVKKMICFLKNRHIEYECQPYIGIVLTKRNIVNPFVVLNTVERQEIWGIWSIFKDSFSYINVTNNDIVLDAIQHIYGMISMDMGIGEVINALVDYFKGHITQLKRLWEYCIENRLDSMMWIFEGTQYCLIEADLNFIKIKLLSLIQDDSQDLKCVGIQIATDLMEQHYSKLQDIVAVVFCQIEKTKDDSLKYKEFYSKLISFMYIAFQNSKDERCQTFIKENMENKENKGKYKLSRKIWEKLERDQEPYDNFDLELISQICQNQVDNNSGFLFYIDQLILWELNNGLKEAAWNNIKNFINKNKDRDVKNKITSTFEYIIENLEDFLEYIYQDIYDAQDPISAGILLLQEYGRKPSEKIQAIHWNQNLKIEKIESVAEKIYVACMIYPYFISYWGLVVITNNKALESERIIEMYKAEVCENYPTLVKEIIMDFEKKDELVNSLLQYCQDINDRINRITSIKDFMPSASRQRAFYLAKRSRDERLKEETINQGSILKLCSKVHFKYGNGCKYIQRIGDQFVVKEVESEKIKFEIKCARIYYANPILYNDRMEEVFKGGIK